MIGKFELLFCFEGLVRVEIDLKLEVNESRGMIDKGSASRVFHVNFGHSRGGEKLSVRAADEVVDGDPMPGNNVVSFENVRSDANNG